MLKYGIYIKAITIPTTAPVSATVISIARIYLKGM